MFVANTALPQLVHWNVSFMRATRCDNCLFDQMYPINLISVVVEKVPSAHVLISGINDLICAAHLERRIFTVNLVAQLAKKVGTNHKRCLFLENFTPIFCFVFQYTIAPALAAVEFVEDVLFALVEAAVNEETIVLFINVCDALATIMRLGHPHDELVVALLRRVRAIANARCALYAGKIDVRESPEQFLISKINHILGC